VIGEEAMRRAARTVVGGITQAVKQFEIIADGCPPSRPADVPKPAQDRGEEIRCGLDKGVHG
jgi:hypothetical protein